MRFDSELVPGKLIQRYKRFLADVEMADGRVVTAHCANPGSMMGVNDPGAKVWLSPSPNPKAKLPFRWEIIEVGGALVGINTSRPNRIVEEAIANGEIEELTGYGGIRREVKYGENSRIDLLLEEPGTCYVEVKNVTLRRAGRAEFPDAVTKRGAKHLRELMEVVKSGGRAVMFYLAQRDDCDEFGVADDIDPEYGRLLREAVEAGVEALAYACAVSPRAIEIRRPLPIRLERA